MVDIQDRVAGVLLGLAAGDRIGGPTRMALHLAESLLECAKFDRHDISMRYLTWWQDEGFDTGPTANRVFELVTAGQSFDEAATQVHRETGGLTAGCNPAHRIVPLAMANTIADHALAKYAKEEAALTHTHSLAGEVAAAAVVLCRALIRGADWASVLDQAQRGRDTATQTALLVQSGPLQPDGFAPHVLSAAVYFAISSPDFDTMIQRSIAFAGPPNYCPVLAGSLGGARWGASHISGMWLRDDALTKQVWQAAKPLADTW
ncbi:MAG: ADP-ribosylglycohydrolase family protein [Chloroflexota bacterium]